MAIEAERLDAAHIAEVTDLVGALARRDVSGLAQRDGYRWKSESVRSTGNSQVEDSESDGW